MTDVVNVAERAAPRWRPPVVYCAGKIAKDDWRHSLFPMIRGELFIGQDCNELTHKPENPIVSDGVAYGGPFFLSCDHGCAHGTATHGLGVCGELLREPRIDFVPYVPEDDGGGELGPGFCCGERLETAYSRGEVVAACVKWLSRCDYVFVWVDHNFDTAFGSMTEIGMATIMGKPIVAGVDCRLGADFLREMWFPLVCGTMTIPAVGPIEAFSVARRYITKSWSGAYARARAVRRQEMP